jgi:undecaprenyl-diphosphatase
MTLIHALILSIVEGITEFLPVSSTGHMILAAKLLALQETEFVKSFEVIIQLGAILAIAVLYRKMLVQSKDIWLRVIIAFIPTGIVGFFLYKIIKQFLLGNSLVTVVALFLGGIALIVVEKIHKEQSHHAESIASISYRQALLIGLGQSLSVIPGVSRAAATIVSGMLVGIKRKTAVEFSFLLAMPTMLAATGLDLLKSELSFSSEQISLLIVGFVCAFLVALIAVKYFIGFVQKHTLIPFGMYRILIALAFWLLILK